MRWARAALAALTLFLAAPAGAQDQAIGLLVDPERVLQTSEFGRSVLDEIAIRRRGLLAETEAISSAFELEERELTDLRETLSRDGFQELADDFDARVRKARADQDLKAAELTRWAESRRRAFFAALNDVYAVVLRTRGASAILDIRSVILADQSLDITAEVIDRVDAARARALDVPAERD
ncbi:MAG: OmpH family outer membrane protein [Pseudomonadota bacterium]